jgi:hypothetical protein
MTGTAYDRIIEVLRDTVDSVKDNGRQALANCPAHNDRHPSLGVTRIEGSVLVNCRSQNCHIDDILAALGLTSRDLYDEPKGSRLATYTYGDGRLVHRLLPGPEGKKNISQSGKTKGTAELYHLDAVEKAVADGQVIFVCEGEKDVLAIESLGAVATTSPMGAGNWGQVDSTPLHGGRIVVIADRDEPGTRHARDVVESLKGKVASLGVVHAKSGKDAADHVAASHGLDELVPADLPDAETEPAGVSVDPEQQSAVDRRYLQLATQLVDATQLDQLPKPEPLIESILYRDSLAWLGGKPGHYKSITALDWSCCIVLDWPWRGNRATPGNVLYVVAEGAHGMHQRRQAWEHVNGRQVPAARLTFLPVAVQLWKGNDTAAVAQLAADLDPVLIVLDTQSRVTIGAEENSSRDMGQFVESLDQLRIATGACILTLHHEPRNAEHLRGSSAMEGAATTIIRASLAGSIVSLNCTKQKDAPAFAPINAAIETVRLGDSPGMSSVAYCQDPVAVTDLTQESEAHVLAVLWQLFGSTGASATALLKASELPERSFYRVRESLVNKGLIVNLGTAARTRYVAAGYQEQL